MFHSVITIRKQNQAVFLFQLKPILGHWVDRENLKLYNAEILENMTFYQCAMISYFYFHAASVFEQLIGRRLFRMQELSD